MHSECVVAVWFVRILCQRSAWMEVFLRNAGMVFLLLKNQSQIMLPYFNLVFRVIFVSGELWNSDLLPRNLNNTKPLLWLSVQNFSMRHFISMLHKSWCRSTTNTSKSVKLFLHENCLYPLIFQPVNTSCIKKDCKTCKVCFRNYLPLFLYQLKRFRKAANCYGLITHRIKAN